MNILGFTLLYFYYELIFKFSTVRGFSVRAMLVILFFCLFYGSIAFLLSSIPKNKKVRFGLEIFFVFLPVIPCLVEYFVYRQFKILYDFNTVTKGAGDAATGFQDDIKRLVFSTGGMFRIILYVLPTILFIVLKVRALKKEKALEAAKKAAAENAKNVTKKLADGRLVTKTTDGRTIIRYPDGKRVTKYPDGKTVMKTADGKVKVKKPEPKKLPAGKTILNFFDIFTNSKNDGLNISYKGQTQIRAGIAVVYSYVLAIILIFSNTMFKETYDKRYNFEGAVANYGFFTGVRKEIQRKISGKESEIDFDDTNVVDIESLNNLPSIPAKTKTATPIPTTDPNVTEPATTPSEPGATDTPTPTPTPVVYGDSMMNIDFAALAAKDSGTYKQLDEYVSTLTPSKQNAYTGLFKGKNLIFISAEAFSAEVIDAQRTPTLYRMATKGINFNDYYQPAGAGTTGGEYQNIFGMLPSLGGDSFKKTATYNNYFVMGNQLNREGYWGKAYHNNDYQYYSRHKTHINLGYSEGFMGYGNGMENYVKKTWPQSDQEMIEGTLNEYIDHAPFNIYYMSVSGHSGYSKAANAMSRKNWATVEALSCSDDVKAYLAANQDLENAMASLMKVLEEKNMTDDTVIVISADHFPYGLDAAGTLGNMPLLDELYGYHVTNALQRDHNRAILWCGELEKSDPIIIDSPTFSLDLLPTLSNLFGLEWDSRLLPGRDILSDAMPLIFDGGYNWKTDYGTYVGGKFTATHPDVTLPDNYVKTINAIVANKISYCKGVLNSNYFGHLYDMGVLKG